MKTKYALVLSGGGFNGAFQVGALKYIAENWQNITGQSSPMKFDIISGVSAGAINGALVAMNELSLLHNLWMNQIGRLGASEIYTSDFIDTKHPGDQLKVKIDLKKLTKKFFSKFNFEIGIFEKIGLLFSKNKRNEVVDRFLKSFYEVVQENIQDFKAIADNSPLHDKLVKYLDRSKIKDTIFTCGFVSMNTGVYHSVKQSDFLTNNDFVSGIQASAAIPFVWEPVHKTSFISGTQTIHAYNNIDGGVMNVSPLGDVIKLIKEDQDDCRYKIIIINCNSGIPSYEDYTDKSIGSIISRAFYQLTLTEVFNNDLQHFLRINEIVKKAENMGIKTSKFDPSGKTIQSYDAIIINPQRANELGNPLVANEKLIYQRIAQGYHCAKHSITF